MGEEVVRFEEILISETLSFVGELEHGLEIAELDLETARRSFFGGRLVAGGERGESKSVESLVAVGMVFAEKGEIKLVGLAIGLDRRRVVAELAIRVADPPHRFGHLDVLAGAEGLHAPIEDACIEGERLAWIPRGTLDFAEKEKCLERVGMRRA